MKYFNKNNFQPKSSLRPLCRSPRSLRRCLRRWWRPSPSCPRPPPTAPRRPGPPSTGDRASRTRPWTAARCDTWHVARRYTCSRGTSATHPKSVRKTSAVTNARYLIRRARHGRAVAAVMRDTGLITK